ncbi:MAG: radical SAM protein [Candidatus Lernaella stagnicola]|nr:radical SAM protein [Candidatus Lernaella stagnicola]
MSRLPADRPLRIALVNPPFRRPVMRRFVASYFAPNFLLPPTDLLYVSAALKQRLGSQTDVIDCIARGFDRDGGVAAVTAAEPDVVFAQLGFATLESDLAFCDAVGRSTGVPVVAMGYLPTMFGREVLAASQLDAVVGGEPEIALGRLLEAWRDGESPSDIPGITARQDGRIVAGPPPERITDLDALPFPDHDAVDLNLYRETLLGSPIAAIFTARGCPYPCTFCVRTFGRMLVMRSAASVLAEAERVVTDLGIRKLRFMDDTFNINESRTVEICEGLQRLGPLEWTALARLDRITPASVEHMARAGCRRLYVGVESGSDRMLREYKKGTDLATMRRAIGRIHQAGMEASGFFIVGGPSETRADFEASVAFAKETKLDYVIVTRLQYWPGTELFERVRDQLEVSVVPFRCQPKDAAAYERHLRLERSFYRRFYFRPRTIWRQLRRYATRPGELLRGAIELGRYLLSSNKEDFI